MTQTAQCFHCGFSKGLGVDACARCGLWESKKDEYKRIKPQTAKYLYAYQRILSRHGDGSYTTSGIQFSAIKMHGENIMYVGKIVLEPEGNIDVKN